MFKKLMVIGLILTMMASTSIPIFADINQTQNVTYFSRDIYVNGERIVNYQSATPYFIKDNSVYIPLTAENGKIFGFQTKINTQDKIIEIAKADISQKNYTNKNLKNTKSTFTVKQTDYKLFYVPDQTQEPNPIQVPDQTQEPNPIQVPDQAQEPNPIQSQESPEIETGNPEEDPAEEVLQNEPKWVYLGKKPIYLYQNTYYVALSVLATIEELGWSSYYTPYVGLYISTIAGKEANSFVQKKTVDYNKTLMNYIIKENNSGMSEERALNLLFLIRQKCQLYGVDELLVIALISKESSFNEKAVARGGALGLMQIMPATGAKAGLSRAQLLTAETNLDFGVKYLANSIKNFDNSWYKGLSAYNQGSGNVSRGSFSRTYYNRVIEEYNALKTKTGK